MSSVGARTVRNRSGQIVQIIGRTPDAVLKEYCTGRSGSLPLEPIKLALARPGRIGVRLGVFRDHDDLMNEYAIWIQRRSGDGRWVAGDGNQPIAPLIFDPDPIVGGAISVGNREKLPG